MDNDGSLIAAPARGLGSSLPIGQSPKKKKRPHHTFKMFGKGGGGGGENAENFAPSIFQMSQQLDLSQGGFSQGQYSQSSQTSFIGNYFGQMTVHDGGMGIDEQSYSGDGYAAPSGSGVCATAPSFPSAAVAAAASSSSSSSSSSSLMGNSNSSFQLAFPPSRLGGGGNPSFIAASASAPPAAASDPTHDRSRQITLPAVAQNPFQHFSVGRFAGQPPQNMWISAFKPWPRFTWDFESQGVLGEGVQSLVYCARKRVDGCLYAIKKLRRQILTEKEGLLLTREVCALSAFSGCPNILRYYSSWIEDGYLHIQTELCQLGSLDILVGAFSETGMEFPGIAAEGSALPGNTVSADEDHCGLFGSQEEAESVPATSNDGRIELAAAHPDKLVSLSQLPLSQIEISNPFSQLSQSEQMHMGSNLRERGERCGDGDGVGGVPEQLVWLTMTKIAQALAFLHARDVAHLDVRPANIFVAVDEPISFGVEAPRSSDDSAEGTVRAALVDLLRTAPYRASPDPVLLAQSLLHGMSSLRLGDLGQCCSVHSADFIEGESRYCPREVINGDLKAIDLRKADVFSLGASCYELCLGRQLGAGGEGALEWHSLRDGVLSAGVVQHYSPELVEAFRYMMHPTPAERPDAQQVVNAAEVRSRGGGAGSGGLSAEVQRLTEENARLRALVGQR